MDAKFGPEHGALAPTLIAIDRNRRSPNYSGRDAVLTALTAMRNAHPDVVPYFRELFKQDDHTSRKSALAVLHTAPEARAEVDAFLRSKLADTEYVNRREAIQAIAQLKYVGFLKELFKIVQDHKLDEAEVLSMILVIGHFGAEAVDAVPIFFEALAMRGGRFDEFREPTVEKIVRAAVVEIGPVRLVSDPKISVSNSRTLCLTAILRLTALSLSDTSNRCSKSQCSGIPTFPRYT